MAINLATKYSDKIAEKFRVESFLAGKTTNEYTFEGVKAVKVATPITVAEGDYARSGIARYGSPADMADTTQTMTMTQDKSFSLIIDKGDNSEQMMIKEAGKMMGLQLGEQTIPTADKFALAKWIKDAGGVVSVASAPSKTTAMDAVLDADVWFTDNLVPEGNRYIGVTAAFYKLIKQELTAVNDLAKTIVEKGVVGELNGMKVVKLPTSYLPTSCYFVAWYKNSCLFPYKINDAKIHQDPPGISGHLLEGRHNYDAFVLGAKANGVYACVLASAKLATPTVTGGALKFTIAGTSSTSCKYTTDGTDPRYSDTATSTTGSASYEVAAAAGSVTVKAVTYASGKFTSDVVTSTVTVTAS